MATKLIGLVDYQNLTNNVANFREYSQRIYAALRILDNMFEENVNTGVGILDGDRAATYKEVWRNFATEFDDFIKMVNQQANNIEIEIKNMRIVDEAGNNISL